MAWHDRTAAKHATSSQVCQQQSNCRRDASPLYKKYRHSAAHSPITAPKKTARAPPSDPLQSNLPHSNSNGGLAPRAARAACLQVLASRGRASPGEARVRRPSPCAPATAMTNQDVVVPDMGIAAAAALPAAPGRALFACRGAAVSSLRGAYGGLGLPGGAATDAGEFLAAAGGRGGAPAPAAANAPPGRTCTSRVVEAIRASSPTRCPAAVDEYDAWTVSCRAPRPGGPPPAVSCVAAVVRSVF